MAPSRGPERAGAGEAAAAGPGHWLVKQEPSAYPFAQLVRDRRAPWDGVRNFLARNHLRAMKRGDLVLYYHTGAEKAVVGIAEVVRAAYPDPTATAGDWSAVDLKPRRALAEAVPLGTLKRDPALADLGLLKQSRLSVVPVTQAEFARILALGKTRV